MKKLLLLLTLATSVFANDSILKGATVGGFAEFRYTDYATTSANKDSFNFDHAHFIVENSKDSFDIKLDALWTDATSTTELEEAWIQWNGMDAFKVKAGRFINSSIWNDNRHVTEHMAITAPALHDNYIPMFMTGLQINGDLGRLLDYTVAYGNGKDSTKVGDNNDSKALFSKVTWKLQDKHLNGLWLSGSLYRDTKDVTAGGVVARTNDYEAYQFESGFKVKAVDILASYAKSKEKDTVLGDIDNKSWYIQPSINLGNKVKLFVRWEDFGVENVIAATDKETKTVGLNFNLNKDVVLKVERKVDTFDQAGLAKDDTYLFSLGMKY